MNAYTSVLKASFVRDRWLIIVKLIVNFLKI